MIPDAQKRKQQPKQKPSKIYAINQGRDKPWRSASAVDVADAASPLDMRALGWTFVKSVLLSALIVVLVLSVADLASTSDSPASLGTVGHSESP